MKEYSVRHSNTVSSLCKHWPVFLVAKEECQVTCQGCVYIRCHMSDIFPEGKENNLSLQILSDKMERGMFITPNIWRIINKYWEKDHYSTACKE